jgi:hypothetical protein
MLGFDHSCTNFSFLAGRSPYFSWWSGICRDQCLFLSDCTVRYLCDVTWSCLITSFAFWEFSNTFKMSSSLIDQLHEHEFILLLANVPSIVARACLCSYASLVVKAWLLAYPSTLSFRLSSPHFFITFCIRFGTPHLIVGYLSRC